jgi:hypothetical protein
VTKLIALRPQPPARAAASDDGFWVQPNPLLTLRVAAPAAAASLGLHDARAAAAATRAAAPSPLPSALAQAVKRQHRQSEQQQKPPGVLARMGAVLSRATSMAAAAIGDPDVTFGYSTVQKVTIRDKRLGLLYYFFVFVILLYVFVYQVGFQQVYRKEGGIVGTARMQLQQPTLQYRTPAPAFCTGVNASTVTNGAGYTFPLPGYYAYQGGVPMEQGVCQYLDSRFAIADPLENGALLLPTRTTLITEVATPLPQCAASGQYDCGWNTVSEQLTFIPDAEWFTLVSERGRLESWPFPQSVAPSSAAAAAHPTHPPPTPRPLARAAD